MRHTGLRVSRLQLSVCAVALMATGYASGVQAQSESTKDKVVTESGFEWKIGGDVSTGTGIRTENRNSKLLKPANAALIGEKGNANSGGGQNADDGNLNYDKGDIYSQNIRAKLNLGVKYENFGAYVSIRGWYDHDLVQDNVEFGNLPNRLRRAELSDKDFTNLAKFKGVELWEAYVTAGYNLAGAPGSVKVGNQNIPWGIPSTFTGGLADINPIDYSAILRPGAPADEYRIPIPAVFATQNLSQTVSVEGFYQWNNVRSEIPGCGTLFSSQDPFPSGCNQVFVTNALQNDRVGLAERRYFRREYAGFSPDDDAQGGGALKYKSAELSTVFGLYGANITERFPRAVVRRGTAISAAPTGGGTLLDVGLGIPGDAGVPRGEDPRAPTYAIVYPEDVSVFGFNTVTQLPKTKTSIAFEITHKQDQPISLNGTDVQRAFAFGNLDVGNPIVPDFNRTSLGGVYNAYDLFPVTQIQAGITQPLPGVLGAVGVQLGAEFAARFISDFENAGPGTKRYGRSDIYNYGPTATGACNFGGGLPAGTPGQGTTNGSRSNQCSFRGYTTDFSWGYRLRGGLLYKDVVGIAGLDVTPFVGFAHDVEGWSDDNTFSEGRFQAQVGIRWEHSKRFYGELAWRPNWGGDYNVNEDRDVFTVSSGMKF